MIATGPHDPRVGPSEHTTGIPVTRRGLFCVSLAGDAVAVFFAYGLAFTARFDWLVVGGPRTPLAPDWSLLVALGATLLSFLAFGLYKREAYLLRTLHVWTVAKATFAAFVVTAVVVYLAKSPAVEQSRFVVVSTFLTVFVLDVVVRIFAITPVFFRWLRREQGHTLVIAGPAQSQAIARRLEALRGFSRVHVVEPEGPNDGHVAVAALVEGLAGGRGGRLAGDGSAGTGRREHAGPGGRIENVFIETSSLSARRTLELVRTARSAGAEVYLSSPLLSPLDGSRLLSELFEMPVVRVRRSPDERRVRPAKRVFDVAGAALALVVLAPLFGAIALAVKLTSRGPVFYRQERVGLRGRRFHLYKFRSMVLHDDHDLHREYVCRLIAGELVCRPADDTEGGEEDGLGGGPPAARIDDAEPLLKLTDDYRVTPVGRVLRKFSLDELPQFWNVLLGDMSLVGPRPALGYEVEVYEDWHRERLSAMPGLSGLWQVSGRSRVGFDEMVLEDVLYSYDQSVLTDVGICLRTIPVVLFGRGAA